MGSRQSSSAADKKTNKKTLTLDFPIQKSVWTGAMSVHLSTIPPGVLDMVWSYYDFSGTRVLYHAQDGDASTVSRQGKKFNVIKCYDLLTRQVTTFEARLPKKAKMTIGSLNIVYLENEPLLLIRGYSYCINRLVMMMNVWLYVLRTGVWIELPEHDPNSDYDFVIKNGRLFAIGPKLSDSEIPCYYLNVSNLLSCNSTKSKNSIGKQHWVKIAHENTPRLVVRMGERTRYLILDDNGYYYQLSNLCEPVPCDPRSDDGWIQMPLPADGIHYKYMFSSIGLIAISESVCQQWFKKSNTWVKMEIECKDGHAIVC